MALEFDKQETGTLLAALRYYQLQGLAENPALRPSEIHDLATVSGDENSLNADAIDALAEKINFGSSVDTYPVTIVGGSDAVNKFEGNFNSTLSNDNLAVLQELGSVTDHSFSTLAERQAFIKGVECASGNLENVAVENDERDT